jgi:mannose/cellobiose epimerase-like protein (N-acyl-D-glucosamine 2-epimerase family)
MGGANRSSRPHLAVERTVADQEEESIEELFGQLWVVRKSDESRVLNPGHGGGTLVWILKELVQQCRI